MKSKVTETKAPRRYAEFLTAGLILLAVVLAMYWAPLFFSDTSIQWDAVDVHYTSQKYFADRLWTGNLPQWTPYIFSGFPFLADPQTGAFYPINWPFYLWGIGPTSIQAELFLHAVLACSGAYFLLLLLLQDRFAAVAGALMYGCSGFFAAHSSHVGMVQTAAWLPWLIFGWKASQQPGRFWLAAVTGLAAGAMILAGHFQSSLYCFAGLGLSVLALTPRCAIDIKRGFGAFALIAALAVLISSVQTLPGLELARQSIRANTDYSNSTDGALSPGALLTLVAPDALGALSTYHGPGDITQYYFYAGFLALPLALCGLILGFRRNPPVSIMAIVLVLLPLWYALGPITWLYRLVALVPGFRNVRAPVHIWFVCSLGLAILASAGVVELSRRFPHWGTKLALAVIAIVAVDLFYWNSAINPLAYGRASFDELYGNQEQKVAVNLVAKQPALTRFHAAYPTRSFGPFNHPLDLKLQATYGYNPLELTGYSEYIEAAKANPLLLNALAVSRSLVVNPPSIEENAKALPMAYFPPEVVAASDLTMLDPARRALVETGVTIPPSAIGQARIVAFGEQSLRIAYNANREGLLQLSVPYFPGWRAIMDGRRLPILRIDHALSGVVVPAGEHQFDFEFHSVFLNIGALFSLFGLLGAVAFIGWGRRRSLQ